ncbi:MAG: hypothetical protein ABL916_23920 [Burkholderiaceae bacterium]
MNFPAYNKGQSIAAATGTATVALAGAAEKVAAARDVLVCNPGPNAVHFVVGDNSVTADNTCPLIPAGQARTFAKGGATHIATLALVGAQTIVVILGEGQ